MWHRPERNAPDMYRRKTSLSAPRIEATRWERGTGDEQQLWIYGADVEHKHASTRISDFARTPLCNLAAAVPDYRFSDGIVVDIVLVISSSGSRSTTETCDHPELRYERSM